MKVIETIENIDFILADEKSVEFINDKALVKLVGLARSGHHFNEEQDRKLSSMEFKDLLCSFTDDPNLLYTLVNRYQNVVLDTEVYALINRDFKECELTSNEDVYLSEFVADKFKETNLPNVLKSEHKVYNLDTMQDSRYYDYIGDFEEFIKKDGTVYNAAHAVKNITVKENIDGIERTKTSTIDFFIDEEGKVISHIFSSLHNDLLMGGDCYYDEILENITVKLNELLENSKEDTLVKRFLMEKKK